MGASNNSIRVDLIFIYLLVATFLSALKAASIVLLLSVVNINLSLAIYNWIFARFSNRVKGRDADQNI